MGLNFPITLSQGTVVGRASLGTGNAEEIPFAQLATSLGVGSTYLMAGSIAGTNTITGTTTGAPVLAANQVVFFLPLNTNTGATTFNRDGTGAKAVLLEGAACVGGELIANIPAALFYDGTSYHVLTNSSAPSLVSVQNGAYTKLASVAGTNTITANVSPPTTAYANGQVFSLIPANTNTGATTVNVNGLGAKNLFELIANAPGDDVTLKKADNHWAEIKSGKVTYRIVGMPDRDFPKVPDHREASYATVESAVLREMIERTLFSVCNDETRFHLNGVYFESDGSKSRMVSTDGHRLSKVERTIANGPKLSAGIIIPKKGLLEIRRVLDAGPQCKIAIKTPHLFLVQDDIAIAVKLIDAQFPPYEQVIPKDHKRVITIDRMRFIDALKRAQLMSSETRGVKVAATKDGVTITSDNPDLGEVREELEAEYNGDAIAIGFNPKYVVELLGQMSSDQITIALGGELDPGLIRPLTGDDYLGVVMPMRI